ncbi:MAG: hypothetical protein GXP25_03355 [Planctomycetes bacterium]|nr:hypothetical protein [Planctomycetota bacterium]
MRVVMIFMASITCLSVAVADAPKPIFRLSFDNGVKPEVCSPGTAPVLKGKPTFVPGRKGQAIVIGKGCSLAFPTKGNLKKEAGTVAVWVRKEDPAKERPKYARIFDMSLATKPNDALMLLYPNHSIVYGVVRSGGKKCTPWPLGEAERFGEEWQHYAITWGPDGAAFYMNGVTLTGSVSMPPLSGLADLFTVGCDAKGEFPACVAIDELTLFDRPLRSHEICEVAGIPAGSDLSRANLLRNSSFELGQEQWTIFPRADFGGVTTIDGKTAFHGKHSLLIDRRKSEGKPWSSIVIIGPWVHLDKGLEVTFSAMMKSDKPGTKVRMLVQRGVQGRTIEKVPPEKELNRYLTVDTEWKRYTITGKLALAYKDGYRPMLYAMTMGSRLWVDAVQLSVGKERAYDTFAKIEMGADTGRPDALYDLGEEVQPHLFLFNNDTAPHRLTIRWAMYNPYGKRVWRANFRSPVDAGKGRRFDVSRLVPAYRGQYRMSMSLIDEDGKKLERREYALGMIRSHADTPSPATSPFGVHGNPGEKGRRIGLKQLRDCGGLNWKWIEPKQGDWRTQFIERRIKKDQELGYISVKTLAQSPKWASMKGANGVPASLDGWKGYVRRVVTEFKPYVKTWEVWNEPNLDDYFKAHPDYYVKLLKAAYETAKEVDPDCTVIGICLAGVGKSYGTPWIRKVFELGALKYMDGLALHPYRRKPPEKAGFVEALREVKDMMRKHGGVKPMYFTEFGTAGTDDKRLFIPWYCGERNWSEEEEAWIFVRTNVLSLAEGAKYLYWYKWNCERQQVGPDTHGFFRPDAFFTPKKLVLAYNELIWKLENATFDSRIDTGNASQHLCAFRAKGGWVTVMWDEDGESEVTIKTQPDASMTDIWGNEQRLKGEEDGFAVQLSESAVYLVTKSKPEVGGRR